MPEMLSTHATSCGQRCPATLRALSVHDDSGISLRGNFAVTLDQLATDEEEVAWCAVSDGDEDGDEG